MDHLCERLLMHQKHRILLGLRNPIYFSIYDNKHVYPIASLSKIKHTEKDLTLDKILTKTLHSYLN